MKGNKMRIAIVYNEPKPSLPEKHWLFRSSSDGTIIAKTFQDASEYGVLQEIELVEGFLRDGGHETMLFAVEDPSSLVEFLVQNPPDLIFNCCETFRGNATLEMNVAAIFEILGIPFTGSAALTLGMASNKNIAKTLFIAHGVPTPPWVVISPNSGVENAGRLRFPLIVKPLNEDGSIGIDTYSIVETQARLIERAHFVWNEFRQPALVEEFIEGRELNVAILAVAPDRYVALPVSEILFKDFSCPRKQILTYEAKWMVDSPYYSATVPCCPAELSPELADKVRSIALKAAAAVQMRDYGRIDLRVCNSSGAVFVLEANPNPDITADSGFVRAAQASGRTHASVILEIVERVKERMQKGDSGLWSVPSLGTASP
jgi:D-alanine-D-alanine ligase